MPQLSQRFGPIQQQVVLDGSGNGQVTFQPNGSNARITNLFVKVSTVVNQAQCKIYLGTVSDSNIVNVTNSGSTGAAASGQIDINDGQTLFVVWSGGDAGATATATFTGVTVPFDQIGASVIDWADPIAAGDGSLIFPQVKSPNYVAGVSGWILKRNGDVEFGNAVIRGSFTADSGNITLNNGGLHIQGVNKQFDINKNAGFLARVVPDDGSLTQMVDTGLFWKPPDPTPLGNNVSTAGQLIHGTTNPGGSEERVFSILYSPRINGNDSAYVYLEGESSTGSDAKITLGCRDYVINDVGFGGVVDFASDTGDSAAINATETAVLTTPGATYKANQAYELRCQSRYTQGSTTLPQPIMRWRKTNAAGQVLTDTGRLPFPASTNTHGFYTSGVFTIGSSDVIASIALCLIGTAATSIMQRGAAGLPRMFTVHWMGPASNYPDCTVLV